MSGLPDISLDKEIQFLKSVFIPSFSALEKVEEKSKLLEAKQKRQQQTGAPGGKLRLSSIDIHSSFLIVSCIC